MIRKTLLLIGAGGHAKSCIDVIEKDGKFKIVGLVGLQDEVGSKVLGYPIIGTEEELPIYAKKYSHALVTVGHIKSPDIRIRIYKLLRKYNFDIPCIISPNAYVSAHAKLGSGTVVLNSAVVNADAQIGNNCIINSQALIEHDVIISDHCHISTSCIINGGVTIGAGSFIGSNCTLRQGVKIGNNCFINMGQNIFSDQNN